NYQELGRRISEETNILLSSLTSQFSNLSQVKDLVKDLNALIFNSFEQVKKKKEEKITQLENQKQNLDPNDREYNIKSMDIETEISRIEQHDYYEMNRENDFIEGFVPRFQKSFSEYKPQIPSLKKEIEDFCNSAP
ncbi:6703_t:CDS:2, partial [Entrophospora sp. SA101]